MTTALNDPTPRAKPKRSFRAQMHEAREDAIISAVNRLLAEKGFQAMTVDEVAAEVGIAKASLYKHFAEQGRPGCGGDGPRDGPGARLPGNAARAGLSPVAQLKAVARWTMEVQLAGEMPALPSENSCAARRARAPTRSTSMA